MDAMRQASQPLSTPDLQLFPLRLLWPLLGLLAAFVLFFEFIADVGGSGDPRPSPPENPQPIVSPTPTASPFPESDALPLANVVQVIDGDTLMVRINGATTSVRYYGVNAPGPGESCFRAAKEANRRMVAGQAVRLLSDTVDRDENGLLLRYVFLQDGRSVEALLATEGLAQARRGNGTYHEYFMSLEEAARAERVGCLWSH